MKLLPDQTASISVTEQFALAVMLCYHSEIHAKWSIKEAALHLYIPIAHQQIRLWHSENHRAIAFLTWAWMSPEAGEEFQNGILRPTTWQSGLQLWFMDFVCPFGHAGVIARELPRMFPGKSAFWLRCNATGNAKRHYFANAATWPEE